MVHVNIPRVSVQSWQTKLQKQSQCLGRDSIGGSPRTNVETGETKRNRKLQEFSMFCDMAHFLNRSMRLGLSNALRLFVCNSRAHCSIPNQSRLYLLKVKTLRQFHHLTITLSWIVFLGLVIPMYGKNAYALHSTMYDFTNWHQHVANMPPLLSLCTSACREGE